jgi:hypothetical protein
VQTVSRDSKVPRELPANKAFKANADCKVFKVRPASQARWDPRAPLDQRVLRVRREIKVNEEQMELSEQLDPQEQMAWTELTEPPVPWGRKENPVQPELMGLTEHPAPPVSLELKVSQENLGPEVVTALLVGLGLLVLLALLGELASRVTWVRRDRKDRKDR